MSWEYELVVIGSGPAGQRAAVQAAKLGKRVAIVEQRSAVGGACVNTGTIPSKTIREAVLYLTGLNQRSIYGQGYRSSRRSRSTISRSGRGRSSSGSVTSSVTSSSVIACR